MGFLAEDFLSTDGHGLAQMSFRAEVVFFIELNGLSEKRWVSANYSCNLCNSMIQGFNFSLEDINGLVDQKVFDDIIRNMGYKEFYRF